MEHVLWAEIDLDAISHNLEEVKRLIGPATRIMAVVKANAYGHGAYEVANVAISNGATYLAVARLEEALYLRERGIDVPILVFGYVPPSLVEFAVKERVVLTIYSLSQAKRYVESLKKVEKRRERLRCHLKVDTGMGRLGVVLCEDFDRGIEEIESLWGLEGIEWEGIYTHFATADSLDLSDARKQLEIFMRALEILGRRGICFKIRHAANSAAIIQLPQAHLDMVRPGIMLYGIYPSREVESLGRVRLCPAMSLKARVAHVKEVGKGFKISYGSTYITPSPRTIATIPVGYADGYPRILSSRGKVLIRGYCVPIVGRVCMDQFMVDVSTVPQVRMGDEVLLFGRDSWGVLSAEDVAQWADTIGYEIVSSLTSRVRRVYVNTGGVDGGV